MRLNPLLMEKLAGAEEYAAGRDLEETGAVGKEYMTLGKLYPSPGYCGEIIHLYFCKIDRYEQQKLDEGEFLNVEKIPLKKAVEMVLNNEIPDAKTQTAVLKTAMLFDKLEGSGEIK